jgi:hypothetical protein
MPDGHEQPAGPATADQPSEEEMRAAYEAELNRITSSEMILQTAVSLLNIGGRRLGLAPPSASSTASSAPGERDLEQVRDAIDAATSLLPILERRMPREQLGPLRDAVAQLQVAYAREAQSSASSPNAGRISPNEQGKPAQNGEESAEGQQKPAATEQSEGPGPAQASGRLWVPGR